MARLGEGVMKHSLAVFARGGELTDALCTAIRRAGEKLREAGGEPGSGGADANVVRDALITID